MLLARNETIVKIEQKHTLAQCFILMRTAGIHQAVLQTISAEFMQDQERQKGKREATRKRKRNNGKNIEATGVHTIPLKRPRGRPKKEKGRRAGMVWDLQLGMLIDILCVRQKNAPLEKNGLR